MPLKRYLLDRWKLLAGMGTALAVTAALLCALWVPWQAVVFLVGALLLCFALSLGLDWWEKRTFWNTVAQSLETPERLWLLPNDLTEPPFREGELFCQVLDMVARDRVDQVSAARRDNREYREFVETWVHEIKTPMASARLLLANHPGELADALEDELFRLEEYVDQALYYARSGSVEQDYLVRELSLDGVVRAALRRQARPLIAAGFRVEAVDWTATVYTDSKWLEFILGQFISNAVKYRGEYPVLSFRCREEENAIYLTVADNGVGIPAEDLPRIFEKGFTGQNGRRLSRRSTGLGLYLCRKLCRRLGLELSASSQPGAGTQMTVCIPRGQFHLVARESL